MHKNVLLHLVALIWGCQFFLNEIVLNTLDADQLTFYRSLFGTLSIVIIVYFTKGLRFNYSKNDLLKLIVLAISNIVLPFFLLSKGQQRVNANIAAVIMALIPLFTLVLSLISLNEKRKKYTFLSLFLGFVGIVYLIGIDSIVSAEHSLSGELYVIGSAISFAVAIVISKSLEHIDSNILSRDLMIIATLLLLIYGLGSSMSFQITLSSVELISLIVLGVLPSGIVYLLFFKLVHQTTASFASLTNYLVPVYGIFFSFIFLNEGVTLDMVIAAGFIFFSIYLSEK